MPVTHARSHFLTQLAQSSSSTLHHTHTSEHTRGGGRLLNICKVKFPNTVRDHKISIFQVQLVDTLGLLNIGCVVSMGQLPNKVHNRSPSTILINLPLASHHPHS